jgi:hypothetical protein
VATGTGAAGKPADHAAIGGKQPDLQAAEAGQPWFVSRLASLNPTE